MEYTDAQEQREQRRKQRFATKSTHMAQRYLRRMRDLGGMMEQMEPFFSVLERVYVQGLDVERPREAMTVGTYCVQVPQELIYAAGAQGERTISPPLYFHFTNCYCQGLHISAIIITILHGLAAY